MYILLGLLIIGVGLLAIFYLRPKNKNNITEIKYLKTKTIEELNKMFKQMEENGLENEYREYVELKAKAISNENIIAPFSNRKVAYCESELIQVVEKSEQYRDNNGNYQTKTNKVEIPISNEKTSQEIKIIDTSAKEPIIVELNATGCKLDIPKTLDRFEQKNNVSNYGLFNRFTSNKFGCETLGFKMVEKTIEEKQNLYILGEAFKVGDTIHIGKPTDNKKPFIVTTKSEEELINSSNKKSLILLIAGIIAIICGITVCVRGV